MSMAAADSFRNTYALPPHPTMCDLLDVCRQRDIYVHWSDRLSRPAWYLKRAEGCVIMLRLDATVRHLAHELWHDLHEGSEEGDYPYSDNSSDPSEQQAEEFAEALCGHD